jgi:hypothetical protein
MSIPSIIKNGEEILVTHDIEDIRKTQEKKLEREKTKRPADSLLDPSKWKTEIREEDMIPENSLENRNILDDLARKTPAVSVMFPNVIKNSLPGELTRRQKFKNIFRRIFRRPLIRPHGTVWDTINAESPAFSMVPKIAQIGKTAATKLFMSRGKVSHRKMTDEEKELINNANEIRR